MRTRRVLAALALTTVIAVGACSSDSSDTAAPTTTGADNGATVTMKLIAFRPASLAVAAGTEVTWKQTDPGVHTVTSGTVEQNGGEVSAKPDGKFDSGQLATGKTFHFTFDQPGTYSYFCNVHPATMQAQVRVS